MITFNFGKTPKPCTNCNAFSDIPSSIPHCLLGNKISLDIFYHPISPCNRPINSDEFLSLLNSLFWDPK